MRVVGDPPPPFRWCTTISGKRVHLMIPVRTKRLTVCRKVVYEDVDTLDVKGRAICAACFSAFFGGPR